MNTAIGKSHMSLQLIPSTGDFMLSSWISVFHRIVIYILSEQFIFTVTLRRE